MHRSQVLALQSFGRENEYRRALLTICSYWVYAGADAPVVLFTDKPEWFDEWLPG